MIALWPGLKALLSQRELVGVMVARDFRNQYRGSLLGLFWAFLHPASTLALFWFVFQVAFGASSPRAGTPYVVWLAAGLLPWFYFSSGLMEAAGVLREYAFLIHKTSFRLGLLPVVKLLSALGIHVISIVLLVLLACSLAAYPRLTLLQAPYYIVCNFMLMLGLSWICSSVAMFVKDTGHILSISLQFAMWLTPLLWPESALPSRYRFLAKLNPVYYVAEGFRDCFLGGAWFWQHPVWTLYYWAVTLAVLALGACIFTRLRPHFADLA